MFSENNQSINLCVNVLVRKDKLEHLRKVKEISNNIFIVLFLFFFFFLTLNFVLGHSFSLRSVVYVIPSGVPFHLLRLKLFNSLWISTISFRCIFPLNMAKIFFYLLFSCSANPRSQSAPSIEGSVPPFAHLFSSKGLLHPEPIAYGRFICLSLEILSLSCFLINHPSAYPSVWRVGTFRPPVVYFQRFNLRFDMRVDCAPLILSNVIFNLHEEYIFEKGNL